MRFSHRFRNKARKKGPRKDAVKDQSPYLRRVTQVDHPLDLPPANKANSAPPQDYRDQRKDNARSLANAEVATDAVIRRGLLETLTLEQAKRAHHTDRISEPEWTWYAVLWRNAAPRYAPEMDRWLR